MGNFTFLENRWSDLARLGELSEKYVYSDPNTSVIKQGMLAEVMVKYMLAYDGIKVRHLVFRYQTAVSYIKSPGGMAKPGRVGTGFGKRYSRGR